MAADVVASEAAVFQQPSQQQRSNNPLSVITVAEPGEDTGQLEDGVLIAAIACMVRTYPCMLHVYTHVYMWAQVVVVVVVVAKRMRVAQARIRPAAAGEPPTLGQDPPTSGLAVLDKNTRVLGHDRTRSV